MYLLTLSCSNAEVGIGLICACLPAVSALYIQKTRGSSYLKQSGYGRTGSSNTPSRNNEIMLTRSFHVDTSSVNYEAQNMGNDELALVSKHPLSHKGSRSDSVY